MFDCLFWFCNAMVVSHGANVGGDSCTNCCKCCCLSDDELSSSLSFVWTDDFGFLFPFPRQMKFVVDVETLK